MPEPVFGLRTGPRRDAAVLFAEVRKGLLSQLAHPLGHVIALVVGMSMYLGLQFVMGQGELRRDLLPATLIAIAAYWLTQYSALVMVSDLVEEKRGGTFAQSQLSTAAPWVLMLGRLVTAAVFGLVVAVAAAAVPAVVAGVAIPWRWEVLLPGLGLLIDILAFGFLLAAVAVRTAAVAALQSLLTGLIVLLNGSFMPLELYPHWLAVIARLLPTTTGIEAVGDVLFDGASLPGLWTSGSLPLVFGHALALTVLGGLVFRRNHRRARRDGRLGQY